MEKLQLILSAAVGVVAGAIVALKAIAPKTKTLADDKVLERLIQVENALARLIGLGASEKPDPENKG